MEGSSEMSFSQEWDKRYQENTHMGVWPWSDVVSYVMRHARPAGEGFRILELGCGAGANIPFFLSLGVEYHAIEGSPAIVEKLHERFPALKDNIVVGDFTYALPQAGEFDLVLDRASLTHNATADIARCLQLVHRKLKSGGKFIGVDWFSTEYSDYEKGRPTDDPFTREAYREGSFTDVGRVHFSDKPHLLELFSKFDMLVMEHKTVRREIPDDGWSFASWNFVAKKA
jgi:SAM-dependent methyltransferase